MFQNKYISISIGIIFILAGAFLYNKEPQTLSAYAEKLIEVCEREEYVQGCYDYEIPKLLEKLSMEDVFKVIYILQEKDNTYWYCHRAAHLVVGREVEKDPERWLEVAHRCPQGTVCANGCLHGAFQARFRTEEVTPDQKDFIFKEFEGMCDPNEQGETLGGLGVGSCYHGLGHMLLYVTGARLNETIDLCREATKGKENETLYKEACEGGAFMQVFQNPEPEDEALVKEFRPDTKEEADIFCSQFDESARLACLRHSWVLARESVVTPSGFLDFCAPLRGSGKEEACQDSLLYVVVTELLFDDEKTREFCEALPEGLYSMCISNMAARYVVTDYRLGERGIEICRGAKEGSVDVCYEKFIQYAHLNKEHDEEGFQGLCELLPIELRGGCGE